MTAHAWTLVKKLVPLFFGILVVIVGAGPSRSEAFSGNPISSGVRGIYSLASGGGILSRADPTKNSDRATVGGVSVDDFGAKGDGVTDDTLAIQKAFHYCFTHDVSSVSFTEGKTYLLSSRASQNSIVVYGSNIAIRGNGAVIVAKSPVDGYFGAVFDVGGLIAGRVYPIIGKYNGTTQVVRNIAIDNLTIRHDISHKYMNSVGIHNAADVTITNVRVINSPQSGFVIVADSMSRPVSNVILRHCEVDNSGFHAYRVSLQQTADILTVLMDHCVSKGVRNPEMDKEIRGQRVQVWYRAAGSGGDVGLKIMNSTFDKSGVILANMSSRNLVLENNVIAGGIVLSGGRRNDAGFLMRNNTVGLKGVVDRRLPAVGRPGR